MALSVVDLYGKVLPRTNCGDCGHPTCLAFASMVVSEKVPLAECPHLGAGVVARYQPELDAQHAAGKWVKKDPAADALEWARQRAASMALPDLPARIGGELASDEQGDCLVLPFLAGAVHIRPDSVRRPDGTEMDRWEQTFVFNHPAQGGSAVPTGRWKSFEELPNTISKVKSMRANVEEPLCRCFSGRAAALVSAAKAFGAADLRDAFPGPDAALRFDAFPRVPVLLLFRDAEPEDRIEARVKLLFDFNEKSDLLA